MRFEQLMTRSTRGFWAASYSFGLKLFDQYLLRRLSQDQLNAVILADHDKVADVWEHLSEGEHYLARQAGRRYLLRGIQASGGGAFHPKTYLFAGKDASTLVVGSGNLTRDGIDHGREAFTSFSSERDEDLPSMRSWAVWMSSLVEREGDELLAERWVALREACPWMLGATEGSSFLMNEDSSILDQLTERLPESTAELHVTAPFFDEHALALQDLIDACEPGHLTLYFGAGTKVHGPSLRDVVAGVGDVTIKRFEPRTFVHAKLIGAVSPQGSSTLLVGSPNMSRAALTLTGGPGGGGNCETAIVRRGPGDRVRRIFEGSGLELVDEPIDALYELAFDEDHPTLGRAFVLRKASWREDGRVGVERSGGDLPDAALYLTWSDAGEVAPLDSSRVTQEPLNERDPLPLIVWLVDADEVAVSNRVIVDDPEALREAVSGSSGKRASRPREMVGLEAVPLVRLVLWANERFIFDIDDTAAVRRAQDAAAEEQAAEDATGFWERYATEELRYDPRSHTYRPLTPGSGGPGGPVDELLRELETMLHAAPGEPHSLLKVLTAAPARNGEEEPEMRTGTAWTMEARQRIRAYNLLTRWANAIADPRHALIAKDAPIVNYETLLCVLALAWMHEALDRKQLRQLLLALLRAFVGDGEGQGFLGRISQDERDEALQRLDEVSPGVAAGLAAAALERGWRDDIYDWQPVLQCGTGRGVVLPDDWSELLVGHIAPELCEKVDALLENRMNWVDDDTWAQRLAAELELKGIRLDLHRDATVKAGVEVRGVHNPLDDPRLLTVARRAIEFKNLPAVALMCGDRNVIIFEPARGARALVGGSHLRSDGPIGVDRLEEIEAQGGTWGEVLSPEVLTRAA